MKKLLFKLKNLFKKHPLTYDEHDILQLIWKDLDNYDGADGARTVKTLCSIIEELVAELEGLSHTPNN